MLLVSILHWCTADMDSKVYSIYCKYIVYKYIVYKYIVYKYIVYKYIYIFFIIYLFIFLRKFAKN